VLGNPVAFVGANSILEGVRPTIVKDDIEQRETLAYGRLNSF
jgi:hypothetical protein